MNTSPGATRRMRFRSFYPGDVRAQLSHFLAGFEPPKGLPATLRGAAVPHAGWRFSGGVAARALRTLASRSQPTAILVFGAVHRERLHKSAVYAHGGWETPLGTLAVAETLADEVVSQLDALAERNEAAHDSEHSIEVEMPILGALFPGIPLVPIMVPPEASPTELGSLLARLVRGREVTAVASTDLTHYGAPYGFLPAGTGEEALRWMRANDHRMIHLAARLEAESIPQEAKEHRNACGSGALAALAAFAREAGAASGTLLEHTTSHEVEHGTEPFTVAVGYAGMVF